VNHHRLVGRHVDGDRKVFGGDLCGERRGDGVRRVTRTAKVAAMITSYGILDAGDLPNGPNLKSYAALKSRTRRTGRVRLRPLFRYRGASRRHVLACDAGKRGNSQ